MDESAPPIFLVEDDPFDVQLLTHQLTTLGLSCPLAVCEDGSEALQRLLVYSDTAEIGAPQVPRAIFIDLNLPRVDGFAVMRWIRQQRRLANVLLAVVSGSESPQDVERAFLCGADEFVRKPTSAAVLRDILFAIPAREAAS